MQHSQSKEKVIARKRKFKQSGEKKRRRRIRRRIRRKYSVQKMGCPNSKNSIGTSDDVEEPTIVERTTAESLENIEGLSTNSSGRDTNFNLKYPPSETFIVPLGDTTVGKYVNEAEEKQNPLLPKRLQKLMEAQIESSSSFSSNAESLKTAEEIQEKLNKAEKRRQNYLQQKIDTIQKSTQMHYMKDIEQSRENNNDENIERKIEDLGKQ